LFKLEKIELPEFWIAVVSVGFENNDPVCGSLLVPNSEVVLTGVSVDLPNSDGDDSVVFLPKIVGTDSTGLPNIELLASVLVGFDVSDVLLVVEPNLNVGAKLPTCVTAGLLKPSFGSSEVTLPKTAFIK